MEMYDTLEVVGEGSYGVVLKCKHRTSGHIVAVKKFFEEPEESIKRIALREVHYLRQLKHDNVVHLRHLFKENRRYFLVFDFIDHTLLQELELNPRGLDSKTSKRILFQILRALEYVHNINIMHRDIKPENILITKYGIVKVCDFGFARALDTQTEIYTDYVATRWYRAPELLLGDPIYGKPVDIWALGCVTVEMASGSAFLPGTTDLDQLHKIVSKVGQLSPHFQRLFQRNTVFSAVSLPEAQNPFNARKKFPLSIPLLVDVVHACLKMDPPDRASAAELLQYEYFTRDGFVEKFLPELQDKLQHERRYNALLEEDVNDTEVDPAREERKASEASVSQTSGKPFRDLEQEINLQESKAELKVSKIKEVNTETRNYGLEENTVKEIANQTMVVRELPKESKAVIPGSTTLTTSAWDLTAIREFPTAILPIINPNAGNINLSSNLLNLPSTSRPVENTNKRSSPLHALQQPGCTTKQEEGSMVQIPFGKSLSQVWTPKIEKTQTLNKKKNIPTKSTREKIYLPQLPAATGQRREFSENKGRDTRPSQEANASDEIQAEEDSEMERQEDFQQDTDLGETAEAIGVSMTETEEVEKYEEEDVGNTSDEVFIDSHGKLHHIAQHVRARLPYTASGHTSSQIPHHMRKSNIFPHFMPEPPLGPRFQLRGQVEEPSRQIQMDALEGFQQELLINSRHQCQLMVEQHDILNEQTSIFHELSRHLEATNVIQRTMAVGISRIEIYSSKMNTTMSDLEVLNRTVVNQMMRAQEAIARNLESITTLLERQENSSKGRTLKTLRGSKVSTNPSSAQATESQAPGSSQTLRQVSQVRGSTIGRNPKTKRQ